MGKERIQTLINYLDKEEEKLHIDAVVVEGYDGVGKGYVLRALQKHYGVTPYRPDYDFWGDYDHRYKDRWKVSGFFWDVFSHFFTSSPITMLFDRGVLSGAVYNDDTNISSSYPILLGNKLNVIHIIVRCKEEDYNEFKNIRGSIEDTANWDECEEFTTRFIRAAEQANVRYVIYDNHTSDEEVYRLKSTCEGCGHYEQGFCTNVHVATTVNPASPRCSYSGEKEVQDKDAAEMY